MAEGNCVDVAAPADRVTETHISRVICRGDLAFKVKKPITTDFLDQSSRAERRRLCEVEVRLNRRLAPDVYLGTAEIDGEPAVVMRRMPEDRRLSRLVNEAADVRADLTAVARAIAVLHGRAARSDVFDHVATARALGRLWTSNLLPLGRFVPDLVSARALDLIERLVVRYLAGRAGLLQARIAAGNVCDGHGDLLADDIYCLEDGPRILDCIEFNDVFRWGDIAADVAFLAMDLERLGHPELSEHFLAAYQGFSGDTWPPSLMHLYIAYRAVVRAKVACLRYQQGDGLAAAESRRLLSLALEHLRVMGPFLLLIGGPPGSGKSTIAEGAADALGWMVLRTDEIRHDVAGLARDVHAPSTFGTGIYDPETTERTYSETLRRAHLLLASGQSVIIDATWADPRWREAASGLASSTHSELIQLRCDATESPLGPRVARRTNPMASDASPDIAQRIAATFAPWPDARPIDTGGDPRESVAAAVLAILVQLHVVRPSDSPSVPANGLRAPAGGSPLPPAGCRERHPLHDAAPWPRSPRRGDGKGLWGASGRMPTLV